MESDDVLRSLGVISDETREKMRRSARNRAPMSVETKAKISASHKKSQWRRRGSTIGIGIGKDSPAHRVAKQ